METIRKNTVAENNGFEFKFRLHLGAIIVLVVLFLGFIITPICLIATMPEDWFEWPARLVAVILCFSFGALTLLLGVVAFFMARGFRCTVSDRRIYGRKTFLVYKYDFSYRFDQITDVHYRNVLGFKSVLITFKQGNILDKKNEKKLLLQLVHNGNEAYNYLTNELVATNNDVDVLAKILSR